MEFYVRVSPISLSINTIIFMLLGVVPHIPLSAFLAFKREGGLSLPNGLHSELQIILGHSGGACHKTNK